jgi:hypothetical protein
MYVDTEKANMLNKHDRRGVVAWGLGRHVEINCDSSIKVYCPSLSLHHVTWKLGWCMKSCYENCIHWRHVTDLSILTETEVLCYSSDWYLCHIKKWSKNEHWDAAIVKAFLASSLLTLIVYRHDDWRRQIFLCNDSMKADPWQLIRAAEQ